MAYRNIQDSPARAGGWSKLIRLAADRLVGGASARGKTEPREAGGAEASSGQGWQSDVLRDPALQARFEKEGYARLPALDPQAFRGLLEDAHRVLPGEIWAPAAAGSPYHCSFIHADREQREQVQAAFTAAFTPYVETHLKGYRVLHAALHVKPPGGGNLPFHPNWSSVADLDRSTVTLWCPLVDVDAENGTLEVIPGSHRITRLIEDNSPRYYDSYREILPPLAVAQAARAGDVIMIEDTILHGSKDNRSDRPRIAAQIVCIPKDATPVYYFQASADVYEVIAVEDDFFIRFDASAVRVRQKDWKSLGFVRRAPDRIDAAEFLRRIADPSAIRRRGFNLEPAAGPGA
jgi:hypothetical protein